ncbi:MAG: type II secretion system protein, partial [Campylobacterales bacterium]|nr:type II secretion system protein [Campylobacterales bacterium]
MKRSGFTMIELIFVIVILGILAAVAIPRLAATRDDAKISTKIQEATQFLQEMGATYTAKGSFLKVSEMSNVKLTEAD